jgi:hypothetical protein
MASRPQPQLGTATIEEEEKKDPIHKRAFFDPLTPDGDEDPASRVSRAAGLRTPGEALKDISGQTGVEAIKEGQRLQEQFAREALSEQDLAQLQLEETLSPFVGFGTGLIGQTQGLFGPGASSPTLDQFSQSGMEQLRSNPMLRNISPGALEQQRLINDTDLLSRERGDLLSAIGIGQASAAQTAAGDITTGDRRGDLLSQIGNVRAAGGIGQAQAMGQGASNLAGIGSTVASAFNRG